MALVRGTGLVYAQMFVRETFGEEAWRALLASLPAPEREIVASATERRWYDLRILARVERGVAQELGGGDLRLLERMGRFEADLDIERPMRWFFQVVPPDMALRHIDLYWRRFHDSGRWVSEKIPGGMAARLHDWGVVEPALCATIKGYLGRVLERIGRRVTIEHARCRAHGAPSCEMLCRFEGRTQVPQVASPGPADVMAIAHELSRMPDRGSLARAVTSVMVSALGFRRALLWGREPGRGEPLARAGAPCPGQAPPHRFALEARGCAQGCIELEPGADGGSWEALDLLLPWIGLALSGVPCPEAAREARVGAASAAWGLTARQAEVLGAIARGRSNKDIAADLGVNEGTVEIHVTRLLRKADADNRAALVARLWELPPAPGATFDPESVRERAEAEIAD